MRNVLNNLKPEILQRDGLQAGLAEMTGNLDAIGELDCRLVIENPVPSLNEIRIFWLMIIKYSENHSSLYCLRRKISLSADRLKTA